MRIGRIDNATRVLGAPLDWDVTKYGPCGSLPIRDEKTAQGSLMWSAWFLAEDEIAALVAGAPLYLGVVGDIHPPVCMNVGPVPPLQGG